MTTANGTFEDFDAQAMRGRQASASAGEQIRSLFEDFLLDSDFDKIGQLDYEGPEFDMYRELNALPESR